MSGSRIWRYHAAVGELAIRIWPLGGLAGNQLERIHRWIEQAAADQSLCLPLPVPALDGRTIHEWHGRSWELTPWLPGTPDLDRPPSAPHVRIALDALAKFHVALTRHRVEGASPGILVRVQELEDLTRLEFNPIALAVARNPADEHAGAGREWLALAREFTPRVLTTLRDAARLRVPLQPCLRDARPEHFLFQEHRLTGLIDFGAMGMESVAADLARLMGDWLDESPDLRSQAIAAYAKVRPLGNAEASLIPAFEAAADILIARRWLTWHFVNRRRFDVPGAVSTGIERGMDRLRRLAARDGRPAISPRAILPGMEPGHNDEHSRKSTA